MRSRFPQAPAPSNRSAESPLRLDGAVSQHTEVAPFIGLGVGREGVALACASRPDGLDATTGDLIRITVTGRQPAQSPCKWGSPVEASRISRP